MVFLLCVNNDELGFFAKLFNHIGKALQVGGRLTVHFYLIGAHKMGMVSLGLNSKQKCLLAVSVVSPPESCEMEDGRFCLWPCHNLELSL